MTNVAHANQVSEAFRIQDLALNGKSPVPRHRMLWAIEILKDEPSTDELIKNIEFLQDIADSMH